MAQNLNGNMTITVRKTKCDWNKTGLRPFSRLYLIIGFPAHLLKELFWEIFRAFFGGGGHLSQFYLNIRINGLLQTMIEQRKYVMVLKNECHKRGLAPKPNVTHDSYASHIQILLLLKDRDKEGSSFHFLGWVSVKVLRTAN